MLEGASYDTTATRSTVAVEQYNKPKTARDWFKLIGPRVSEVVKPFQCGAPWTAFANECELKRLARLQARIDRKQRALSDLKAERRSIMVRCVRRMRRNRGLDL